MDERVASKCRCVGASEWSQRCYAEPSLPYDPYFGVEDPAEKRVLQSILRAHIGRPLESQHGAVRSVGRNEAPPLKSRLRYKVCQSIYGQRPRTSEDNQRQELIEPSAGLKEFAYRGAQRPATTAMRAATPRIDNAPIEDVIPRLVATAPSQEALEYGMVQLAQAFARRALPWTSQLCPQAFERVEMLRLQAERDKELQLVAQHRTDQLNRVREFIASNTQWLAEQYAAEADRAQQEDARYMAGLRSFDREPVMTAAQEWEHEAQRVDAFEAQEHARVNAAEAVRLEESVLAEAPSKVPGCTRKKREVKADKYGTPKEKVPAMQKDPEQCRAEHAWKQEDAASHLWLKGRTAILEDTVCAERRVNRGSNRGEAVHLELMHERLLEENEANYARFWKELQAHEDAEARRVHKEARVQDALARASSVYLMHMLVRLCKPLRDKKSELVWEIKRAGQMAVQKRRSTHEQRIMDADETQMAQRELHAMLRSKQKDMQEELDVWLTSAKRRLEKRTRGIVGRVRVHVKRIRSELGSNCKRQRRRLRDHRKRDGLIVALLATEEAARQDMRVHETRRLKMEVHERKCAEEGAVQTDRRRLNEMILTWRAEFTAQTQESMHRVGQWTEEMERVVAMWIDEADQGTKAFETQELMGWSAALEAESTRVTQANTSLVTHMVNQFARALDQMRLQCMGAGAPVELNAGKRTHVVREWSDGAMVLEKVADMWTGEAFRVKAWIKGQADARAAILLEEQDKQQAAYQEFVSCFFNVLDDYQRQLGESNAAARETVMEFFCRERALARAMVANEDDEALAWETEQIHKVEHFISVHRARCRALYDKLEHLKTNLCLDLYTTDDRSGGHTSSRWSSHGQTATGEGSAMTWPTGDTDHDSGNEVCSLSATSTAEGESDAVRILETALQISTKDRLSGTLTLEELQTIIAQVRGPMHLSAQDETLVLAFCTAGNVVEVMEFLRRAAAFIGGVRIAQVAAATTVGDTESASVLRKLAEDDVKLAVHDVEFESRVMHGAGPMEQHEQVAGSVDVRELCERCEAWSTHISAADVQTVRLLYREVGFNKERLLELLIEVRSAALLHSAAWVARHTEKDTLRMLKAACQRVVQKRSEEVSVSFSNPGAYTAAAAEKVLKQQKITTATAAGEGPPQSAARLQAMITLAELADVLQSETTLALSKPQILIALSEVAGIHRPSALVDGRPAYSINRCTALLARHFKEEFRFDALLAYSELLASPVSGAVLHDTKGTHSNLVEAANAADIFKGGKVPLMADPPSKPAFVSAVCSSLASLEGDSMGRQLPTSVIRDCLTSMSGKGVMKGVKPGMVDAALAAATERLQMRMLREDDTGVMDVYGRIVSCRSECAVDHSKLVPRLYEPLMMLVRREWLRGRVEQLIHTSRLPPSMSWTELVTARQERLQRRAEVERRSTKEQWQVLTARLRHERTERRLTCQLVLDVHSLQTTKFAESLLRGCEGPLEVLRVDAMASLDRGLKARQARAAAIAKHVGHLDKLLAAEMKGSCESMTESALTLWEDIIQGWRSLMTSMGDIHAWVTHCREQNITEITKWRESALRALNNAEETDTRRRREEEVLLSLACMDSTQGTNDFIMRLTAEANKVIQDASAAPRAVVDELAATASQFHAEIESLMRETEAKCHPQQQRSPTRHTVGEGPELGKRPSRKGSIFGGFSPASLVAQRTDASMSVDEALATRQAAVQGLQDILANFTETCGQAERRVDHLSPAAEKKLAKLQSAVNEQIATTVTQHEARLEDHCTKQVTAHGAQLQAASEHVLSGIARETRRLQASSEERESSFHHMLEKALESEDTLITTLDGQATACSERAEKALNRFLSKCDEALDASRAEEPFIQDLLEKKYAIIGTVMDTRSGYGVAMHTKAATACRDMIHSRMLKWVEILRKARVHDEARSALDTMTTTVELRCGCEMIRRQCKERLDSALRQHTTHSVGECRSHMTASRDQLLGVVKAYYESVGSLKSTVTEHRDRLTAIITHKIERQDAACDELLRKKHFSSKPSSSRYSLGTTQSSQDSRSSLVEVLQDASTTGNLDELFITTEDDAEDL